jgi:hypothetical protein
VPRQGIRQNRDNGGRGEDAHRAPNPYVALTIFKLAAELFAGIG